MAAAKLQKEKPINSSPRLMPRPTAASAARAARNATSRNNNENKVSPNRAQSALYKGRNYPQRSQKPESKSQVSLAPVSGDKCLVRNISELKQENTNEEVITPNNKIDDRFKNPDTQVKHNDNYEVHESSTKVFDDPMVTFNNQVVTSDDQVPVQVPVDQTNAPDVFTIPDQLDNGPYDKNDIFNEQNNTGISRPTTPSFNSRPQTPCSQQSRPLTPLSPSRPVTPNRPVTPSRPVTPAHPQQQNMTRSRPNTPRCYSARGKAPTPKIPSSRNSTSSPPHKDDLKSTFLKKQKQFQVMKKELDLKQQAVLQLFDNLRGLQERMVNEGISDCGKRVKLEELVVFNVADWATEEVSQLCRDAAASHATDDAIDIINCTSPIDESALMEINKVADMPDRFADLCLQAFTARQEVIDWVKGLLEKDVNYGGGESLDRIEQFDAHGLELCTHLHELKSCADTALDTVSRLSKQFYKERSTLAEVGESLVREIERLRQDLNSRPCADMHYEPNSGQGLEALHRELAEERTTRVALKDKLAASELQLRQARVRITKMDRQLREAETSIAGLTVTVNSLEEKNRQKEVQLEARARKLKESLKTAEITNGQIVHQRGALQSEILDLKQQIETMVAQHKSAVDDLNKQLKATKCALEEQCKLTEKEIGLKKAAEAAVLESHNIIENLQDKITKLEKSMPNPDMPTEREMDLWAELQATKDTLRVAEEEVNACKREKTKFLESFAKITESDNKAMQQKLAAELLSKEEILGKMQTQMRELTKNVKLNEQKVIQYEQFVRELQSHYRAIINREAEPNGKNYEDLQQEAMSLRVNLLDAAHRNDELSELLAQKEQQLEQQDKTSRAQARLIKVREELISMLKNKETEQGQELVALQRDLEHRMKIVDDVNKQISAKAEEIQKLFETLETKQQQIHRLEKIVIALEEQQRRAQAQRTRHEEKIALLEHELAASGIRREKKFLFF